MSKNFRVILTHGHTSCLCLTAHESSRMYDSFRTVNSRGLVALISRLNNNHSGKVGKEGVETMWRRNIEMGARTNTGNQSSFSAMAFAYIRGAQVDCASANISPHGRRRKDRLQKRKQNFDTLKFLENV